MKLKGNSYTFLFACMICVVCSFSLAAVSQGLKAKQELNIALDIKKNILKAVALRQPLDKKATVQDVLKVYEQKIQEVVVNQDGHIVEGKSPLDLVENPQEGLYPLYIYKEGPEVIAYCFPVEGKGLWSTLYGYFAIEPDAITVRGITFYKHGETPGLGAEIEQDWFQNNFQGKKIWSSKDQKLTPTKVVKGQVEGIIPEAEAYQYVDGISGATMTSKGVTELLDRWIKVYEPFLVKIRKS